MMEDVKGLLELIVVLNLIVSGLTITGLFKLWRFLEVEMPRRRRKAKQKEESS